MRYYKNEIDGELVGLTTAPYEVTAVNFTEISEEEYLELGGTIPEKTNDTEIDVSLETIIDAIIE